MKYSQIAAKIAARLVLIAVFFALVPFFTGNMDEQMKNIYISTNNIWLLIPPIVIILGFVALLITCTIKKYNEADFNWLLVLNSAILLVYGVTVFVKIEHMIK